MKAFRQKLKERLRMLGLQLGPIAMSFALSFLSIALMGGALLILASVKVLGGAMWAVLLVYLGGLAALVALIHRRRDLRELRGLIGDEEFFKMYPAELRRERRKQQKKNRKKGNPCS